MLCQLKKSYLHLQVIGVLGLALSIYLIIVNNYFSFVPDNTVLSGAVLILVASVCTFVIAAIGFVGAAFKLRVLLIIVSHSIVSPSNHLYLYSSFTVRWDSDNHYFVGDSWRNFELCIP